MTYQRGRSFTAPDSPPSYAFGDYVAMWAAQRLIPFLPFVHALSPLVLEIEKSMSELTDQINTLEANMADAKARVQTVLDRVTSLSDELALLTDKIGESTFTPDDLARIRAINDELVSVAAAPLPPPPPPDEPLPA